METTTLALPPRPQAFIDFVNKELKLKVTVKEKSKTWLMKAIAWLFTKLRINPTFQNNFYTTINQTIYIPEGCDPNSQEFLEVLAHECVHAYDAKRFTFPLFALLYLSPQILAVLLLPLAFVSLWFLLSLLLLAPLPALGRAWFELRGYRTSVLFARKLYNRSDADMQGVYDWIVPQFVGSNYYFMFPFKSFLIKQLKKEEFMTDSLYVKLLEGIK